MAKEYNSSRKQKVVVASNDESADRQILHWPSLALLLITFFLLPTSLGLHNTLASYTGCPSPFVATWLQWHHPLLMGLHKTLVPNQEPAWLATPLTPLSPLETLLHTCHPTVMGHALPLVVMDKEAVRTME